MWTRGLEKLRAEWVCGRDCARVWCRSTELVLLQAQASCLKSIFKSIILADVFHWAVLHMYKTWLVLSLCFCLFLMPRVHFFSLRTLDSVVWCHLNKVFLLLLLVLFVYHLFWDDYRDLGPFLLHPDELGHPPAAVTLNRLSGRKWMDRPPLFVNKITWFSPLLALSFSSYSKAG